MITKLSFDQDLSTYNPISNKLKFKDKSSKRESKFTSEPYIKQDESKEQNNKEIYPNKFLKKIKNLDEITKYQKSHRQNLINALNIPPVPVLKKFEFIPADPIVNLHKKFEEKIKSSTSNLK